MKKKIFTILFALVAGFGFSWASTITVTWNNNDITGSGNSFTKDGVTITAGMIDFYSKNLMDGGTFTTTLGNFTKIEITARSAYLSGTGWIRNTWTGNASSVSFSGDIYGRGTGVTMVFTIETPTVDVTGVTLSQTEATLNVDETLTLTATVAPDEATDKTVTWTSSDPTVATVADGVVTAVAAGTATITATATNGTDDTADDKTATCTITVTDPDQEAADAVVVLFDALPAADAVTVDSKEAIEAARAAYEALTDEQKALVTPEDLAKLTAAEAALAALIKEGVENVQGNVKNVKIIENGQLLILRGDKTYTLQGQEVK